MSRYQFLSRSFRVGPKDRIEGLSPVESAPLSIAPLARRRALPFLALLVLPLFVRCQPHAPARPDPDAVAFTETVHEDVGRPILPGASAYAGSRGAFDVAVENGKVFWVTPNLFLAGNYRSRSYRRYTALEGMPRAPLTAVARWRG